MFQYIIRSRRGMFLRVQHALALWTAPLLKQIIAFVHSFAIKIANPAAQKKN